MTSSGRIKTPSPGVAIRYDCFRSPPVRRHIFSIPPSPPMNSSSSNPPRVGLSKKAADEARARRLTARDAEAEGLLLTPRGTKRQKSVTPSQLLAESQSLLSPMANDEIRGTALTSAVEVNLESQLTHDTNFPGDSSVSSVSITAADGATFVAAVSDSAATNTVTANSTMATARRQGYD